MTPFAAAVRTCGWPAIEIRGVDHLAIATNPIAVTEAVLDIERSLEQAT